MIFPELTEAEIKVKRLLLNTLLEEKKIIDAYQSEINAEVETIKYSLEKLEKSNPKAEEEE